MLLFPLSSPTVCVLIPSQFGCSCCQGETSVLQHNWPTYHPNNTAGKNVCMCVCVCVCVRAADASLTYTVKGHTTAVIQISRYRCFCCVLDHVCCIYTQHRFWNLPPEEIETLSVFNYKSITKTLRTIANRLLKFLFR